MKYVRRDDGSETILDDLAPATRAVLLLIEHANIERDAGRPIPCRCDACAYHRTLIRCTVEADGTVVIEAAPPAP